MKSLSKVMLAVLCLLLTKTLPAQNSSFAVFADSVFQHLDKTPITTGILYDRTYPLANLHAFNPQADTVNSEFFEQGYFELYQAAFDKSNFLKPEDLTYIRDVENFQGRVPISVLDYRFNWMDTMALQNNQLSLQNGLFYDVPGRSQSPYKEKRVQMVAPLFEELKPGAVTFSFAPYLALNNAGLTVQQIQLSFPTVGMVTLMPNGTATLNFTTEGDFVGTATVTYTNGTSFSNICLVTTSTTATDGGGNNSSRIIGTQGADIPPCWTKEIYSTILFRGYEETQAYRGHQVMNFYYRLNDPSATCNTGEKSLKKLIIIVDGFDPTDRRNASIIYKDFFNYVDASYNTINLAEKLREQGYDVIIVDIPKYFEGTVTRYVPGFGFLTFPRLVRGGGDYIERNAMVLVEVINYVKGHMNSSEKIVIVGPSMGGQISRYALRWMEKNNQEHNCRLWVSMDSPHLGAVLPIGLQNLIKQLSGTFKKAGEMLDNQIDVPAARQQLIHHYRADSETPDGDPSFHNRYYDFINGAGWDPDGKGWPQIPRRVALNSGAHNGLQQSGTSCSDAVWLKFRPKNWVRVLLTTTIGTRLESTIRFSPASNPLRCQVSTLKIKTLLGELSYPSYATHSGPYSIGLDQLPGGWYPGFQELYDNMSAGKLDWVAKVEKELYFGNHTHIPTASAFAYGKGPNPNPNRKWDDDIRSVNLGLTCGMGEIPFQAYQGPLDFNTRHDQLFEAQAQFLINEITQNIATLSGLVISGQTYVCNNRPSYFTVNLPAGGSVEWNPSPAGKVTLQRVSSNTVMATPIGAPTGSYTLIATVTASCITTPVQTQVSFNTTPPPYNCSQVGNGTCTVVMPLCSEQFYAGRGFTVPNQYPDVPYWHWTVYYGKFSDGTTDQIVPSYVPSMFVKPDYSSTACYVYIRPVSECGIEDTNEPFKYIMTTNSLPCSGYYVLSPNPASTLVTVSTIESTAKEQTDRSISAVNIYNQQGMLRKQKKFAKVKTATMSINDLPPGAYVVEILSGDYKEQKQLLIQH